MIHAQLDSSSGLLASEQTGRAVLWATRLAAGLLGALLFFWIYDVRILDPRFIDWLSKGDLAQHFLGWDAFRREPWLWPLGRIENLNFPHGTTVVFTDSLPLFALPLKLFHAYLPDPFQYIGAFIFLSYILVGITAHDLLTTVSRRPLLALLGTVLVLLLPPWHFRVNHEIVDSYGTLVNHDTLMAFWVFIWALRNCFRPWTRSGQLWFAANLLVTAAVHAYLLFIVLIFWGTWCLRLRIWPALRARDWRGLARGGLVMGATLAAMVLEMWVLGYFTIRGGGDVGFGYFSMNLNALFNPIFPRWSAFVPPQPIGTEGQYEGFMYLGLGVLLLGLLALVLRLRSRGEEGELRPAWRWMTLPVAVLGFFALSDDIYLGAIHLLSIDLPGLERLGAVVRSSGRLFWPVTILLVAWILVMLVRHLRARWAALLLAAAAVVQFADIRGGLAWEPLRAQWKFTQPEWQAAFAEAERVRLIPKTRIEPEKQTILSAAFQANRHGIPINTLYLARWDMAAETALAQAEVEALQAGALEPGTLYFLFDALPPLCFFPQAVRDRIRTAEEQAFILPEGTPDFGTPLPPLPGSLDIAPLTQVPLDELVAGCGAGCSLLIAVRDEATYNLPESVKQSIVAMGGRIDALGYRDSYAAIIHEGRVLAEEMSDSRPVTVARELNGTHLWLFSAGKNAGAETDRAVIAIDGTTCGPSSRGLNITRIDWTTRSLSLHRYDTHISPAPVPVW